MGTKRALAVLLVMTSSSPVLAWGQTGHRVTGLIAEQQMSGYSRAKVRLILGEETLAQASTWADEMRSAPGEFWQKTANPWHYVTVPQGKLYRNARAPDEGDAVSALQRFVATLRDPNASQEDKQLALRFIVHIVGDLHQPLHAGNGVDRGGNDIKVIFGGRETNLHALWDSGIIERKSLSYSEYGEWLMRSIDPADVVEWWNPDPKAWIDESAKLRDGIYPGSSELPRDYAFRFAPVIDRRLQQAGIRMAAYLDCVFRPACVAVP